MFLQPRRSHFARRAPRHHPADHRSKVRSREEGGHGIQGPDDSLAVRGQYLSTQEGRDVLGRLESSVVGQDDESLGHDRRIGREEEGDVDAPRAQRLERQWSARVQRDELSEAEPVHISETDQAQAPLRALRWAAEGELASRPEPGR